MGFQIKCLPTFQHVNCCCCQCTLKTCTIIIGMLEVISGAAEVVHGVVALIMFDGKNIPEQHKLTYGDNPGSPVAYQASLAAEILFGFFAVLIGAAVIYAAKKEKTNVLEPILKLELVGLVLSTLFGIFVCIKSFAENAVMGAITVVAVVIALAVGFLLWLIVYSFYRELEERFNPQNSNYPHNIPESGKLNDPEQGV